MTSVNIHVSPMLVPSHLIKYYMCYPMAIRQGSYYYFLYQNLRKSCGLAGGRIEICGLTVVGRQGGGGVKCAFKEKLQFFFGWVVKIQTECLSFLYKIFLG